MPAERASDMSDRTSQLHRISAVPCSETTYEQQSIALCMTVYLMTFSAGCYAVFLGSFLSRKGLNQEIAGIVGAVASAALMGGNLFWGFLSDRLGKRRPLIVLGCLVAAPCLILWLWSDTWWQYAALSAVGQFFFVACSTLLFVMVLDLLPATSRSQRFGTFRLWGSAGLITASWGVGWFLPASPERVFVFAGVALFVAVVPLVLATREKFHPRPDRFHFAHVLRSPQLLVFYACTLLHGIWEPACFLFLSYSLTQQQAGEGMIGIILGLNGVVGMISLPLAGRMADRWGRQPLLVAMYFISAVRMLLYSFVSTPLGLIPVQLLQFGSFGIAEAVGSVYVSELADERDRATAITCFYMAHSTGALVGSAAGGFISSHFGFAFMYQMFSAVMVVTGLLFLRAGTKRIQILSK